MLYCPRCNNTHWARVAAKTTNEQLLVIGLKRRYRCLKCDKILTASIFTDFRWPRPASSRNKTKKKKSDSPACPKCQHETRRSRRKGVERLLVFGKVYRCDECGNRFWTFRFI